MLHTIQHIYSWRYSWSGECDAGNGLRGGLVLSRLTETSSKWLGSIYWALMLLPIPHGQCIGRRNGKAKETLKLAFVCCELQTTLQLLMLDKRLLVCPKFTDVSRQNLLQNLIRFIEESFKRQNQIISIHFLPHFIEHSSLTITPSNFILLVKFLSKSREILKSVPTMKHIT